MIWIVLASIALILFSVYLFRPVPAHAPVESKEQTDEPDRILYYPVNYVNSWSPFAHRYFGGYGGGRRHGGRRGGGRRGGRGKR